MSNRSPSSNSGCIKFVEDIEEELDIHLIRKSKNNDAEDRTNIQKNIKQKSTNGATFLNTIPLLLRDIKHAIVAQNNADTFQAFNGAIFFRNCILHAQIVHRHPCTDAYYKYMIDDGTEVLVLKIARRSQDLQDICHMQTEVDALEAQTCKNKEIIYGCLRRLLAKTSQQLDRSNILPGSRIFIYGKPSVCYGNVSIDAFSITDDSQTNRDMEIAFKDHLIQFYNKYAVK